MRPCSSSRLSASRRVVRETPNWTMRSNSGGSWLPGANLPDRMACDSASLVASASVMYCVRRCSKGEGASDWVNGEPASGMKDHDVRHHDAYDNGPKRAGCQEAAKKG